MSSPSVHVPLLFFTEKYPAAVPAAIVPLVITTLVTSAVSPDVPPVMVSPALISIVPISKEVAAFVADVDALVAQIY